RLLQDRVRRSPLCGTAAALSRAQLAAYPRSRRCGAMARVPAPPARRRDTAQHADPGRISCAHRGIAEQRTAPFDAAARCAGDVGPRDAGVTAGSLVAGTVSIVAQEPASAAMRLAVSQAVQGTSRQIG